MPTLLVIDDEPNIPFSIEQVFDGQEMTVLTAWTAESGLAITERRAPRSDSSGCPSWQPIRP